MNTRLLLLVAALPFAAQAFAVPVVLPVDGLDTADVDYTSYAILGGGYAGIADATSLGPGGGGDHFDDALGVGVNGLAYGPGGGDLTGSTLTLDTVSLGQFDVTVSLQTTGPVLRQLVSVTNTGAAAVATVSWHNNTGNDGGQQTIATSDGDLIAEISDRWVVTADNTTGTNNEVNSWVLFGPDAPAVTPATVALVDGLAGFGSFGEQGLSASFDLSLAAGESRSLMWFLGVEGINQDGVDLAGQFDDTSTPFFAGLISDLSASERLAIANWNLIPEPGSFALAVTAIGCVAWRQRR